MFPTVSVSSGDEIGKEAIVAHLGLSAKIQQNHLVASALDALKHSPLLKEGFPSLPKRIPRKRDDYKCGHCGMKKRNHSCLGGSEAGNIEQGAPQPKRRKQAFKPLSVILYDNDAEEIQQHFKEIQSIGEINVKVQLSKMESPPSYQIVAFGSWVNGTQHRTQQYLGRLSDAFKEYVESSMNDNSLLNVELAPLVEQSTSNSSKEGSSKKIVAQLSIFRSTSWRTKHLSEFEWLMHKKYSTSREQDDVDLDENEDDDEKEDTESEDSTSLSSSTVPPDASQRINYPPNISFPSSYSPSSSRIPTNFSQTSYDPSSFASMLQMAPVSSPVTTSPVKSVAPNQGPILILPVKSGWPMPEGNSQIPTLQVPSLPYQLQLPHQQVQPRQIMPIVPTIPLPKRDSQQTQFRSVQQQENQHQIQQQQPQPLRVSEDQTHPQQAQSEQLQQLLSLPTRQMQFLSTSLLSNNNSGNSDQLNYNNNEQQFQIENNYNNQNSDQNGQQQFQQQYEQQQQFLEPYDTEKSSQEHAQHTGEHQENH